MKTWWNRDDSRLSYCSYTVNNTEVLVGPRLDLDSRGGCSQEFFNSIGGWLVVTESYVEYPINANVRWFPWKEGKEPLPDHTLYGSMKILNFWINELKLPRVYIHCDLGSHRAPTVFGAFLTGYYKDQFKKIEANRHIFNRKHSPIIGQDGKAHGEPSYYIKSYLKQLPLLETMINMIVKYPHLDLGGVVDNTFKDRPLHLYTKEEKEEYDNDQREKEYKIKIKSWLKEKGFQFNDTSPYSNIHDAVDEQGLGTHILVDGFRIDIRDSISKYQQVYFTHDTLTLEEDVPSNITITETSKEIKNDLVLVRWKGYINETQS